ncbi:MAG: hypothetical protein ACFFCD_10510 [Promethearchaeota archaeon]
MQSETEDPWAKLDRLQSLPALLTDALTDTMIFIFRLGWMVGGFVFAIGLIIYMSGIDVRNGKKMIFGGFLLFMLFLYLDTGIWISIFG